VLVDVNAKLDFLKFRAGRLFIFRVLGNVVSELSEIDNLADRRICGGRDFDQIFAEIRSVSLTAKRECAAPPCYFYRNFRRQHSQTPGHSFFATAAIHRHEVLALKFASRKEVVGNNCALARSKS